MTSTDAAKAFLESDSRQALDEVMSFVHPEAADRFRKKQLRALGSVPWTELKNRAGARAKQLQIAVEQKQKEALNLFYGVTTLDELEALLPLELLRRRLAVAYRASSSATRMHLTVIGSVPLDAMVEYVVIERRPGFEHALSKPPSRVEVMTMKKIDGAWRSMLDGGLQTGELFVFGPEEFGRTLPL